MQQKRTTSVLVMTNVHKDISLVQIETKMMTEETDFISLIDLIEGNS